MTKIDVIFNFLLKIDEYEYEAIRKSISAHFSIKYSQFLANPMKNISFNNVVVKYISPTKKIHTTTSNSFNILFLTKCWEKFHAI